MLSLPHCVCFLLLLLLLLLTPTLSFFLFFFLHQNIEAERQGEGSLFYRPGNPMTAYSQDSVPQDNSSERMLFIRQHHCFPSGHSARLYFPGSFVVRWNHISGFWPMEHGSIMGLVAGYRNLMNSQTLEDASTKLEAAWVSELPFERKLLGRSIQPWTPVLDCFRWKITYFKP